MKKKSMLVGFLLTWFLGFIGIHHFYYKHMVRGILYLVFCWTVIPLVLSIIDLFFVPRWTRVANGMSPKLPSNKSKPSIKSAAIKADVEPVSNKQDTVKPKSSKQAVTIPVAVKQEPIRRQPKTMFYSESDIILPKYAHLKTLNDILRGVTKSRKDEGWSSHSDFARKSFKYASKRGTKCDHVPLMEYYTQFRNLSDPQLDWYFYWREQCLNGNYLDTDLSYIYLFVYELINYTFNQNAAFNLSMLDRLLDHYVEQHPNLRFNVQNWINDMLLELGEPSSEFIADYTYGQEYLQLQNDNLHEISMSFWKRHFKNVRETEFFRANRAKVYKVFRQAIDITKEHYLKSGTDLFHVWVVEKETKQERHLFNGAVMARTVTLMTDYITRHLESSERISPELTNLFRLSENVTRILLAHKALIKVDESMLPEGLKERLLDSPSFNVKSEADTRFKKMLNKDQGIKVEVIPPRPAEIEAPSLRMEFDRSRIRALDDESQKFVAYFNEHFASEEEPLKEIRHGDTTEKIKYTSFAVESTLLAGDAGEFGSLAELLTDIEVRFLLQMTEGRYAMAEASRFLREQGMMPGAFLDTLNEKAMDATGDVLIEIDGDEYVLVDDSDEILQQIQS